MSGQSAEDLEFVYIMPSDIRDMARWVVGNCAKEGKGGMITKGIKKTMDSMNDGSSRRFPDPALRKTVLPIHYICCVADNWYTSPRHLLL